MPLGRTIAAALACVGLASAAGAAVPPEVDRSPVDLVVAPDHSYAVTANQGADTISLVQLEGAGVVLDEQPAGHHPSAIEWIAPAAPDQAPRVLVTATYEGTLRVFRVEPPRLVLERTIAVDFHPNGMAISPDGRRVYVARTAAADVAVIYWSTGETLRHLPSGRWPRYLAVDENETRLVVGTSGDRGLTHVDLESGEIIESDRFVGLNIGHLEMGNDGFVYFPWVVYRHNPITGGNIKWGWVLANRLGRDSVVEQERREAISLDVPGEAVADVHGIALTRDRQRIVVSAPGTHELLVYARAGLPWRSSGGTDHLEEALQKDAERFYRIDVGGRPLGLQMGSDDRTVYVANALSNAIQVVDLDSRGLLREIPIGGAEDPSPERRGEMIFYDAERSLDQWYSCHSCHYEGGPNSERIDTWNDDSSFTFKTVPPLYELVETGPWTWHGWQTSLEDAMRKSITSTMSGEEPTDQDVQDLLAYLASLERPPNPYRTAAGDLAAAAARGKEIFEGELGGCADCHHGPHYTDGLVHDLGLGSERDRYEGFNTPALRDVYFRTRLLHDGRANSLEQLLRGDHRPEDVNGRELTDQQLADLIAYLRTL